MCDHGIKVARILPDQGLVFPEQRADLPVLLGVASCALEASSLPPQERTFATAEESCAFSLNSATGLTSQLK